MDLEPRPSAGATFLRASGANSFTRSERRRQLLVKLWSHLSLNAGSVIVLNPQLRVILFYEIFDHRPAFRRLVFVEVE